MCAGHCTYLTSLDPKDNARKESVLCLCFRGLQSFWGQSWKRPQVCVLPGPCPLGLQPTLTVMVQRPPAPPQGTSLIAAPLPQESNTRETWLCPALQWPSLEPQLLPPGPVEEVPARGSQSSTGGGEGKGAGHRGVKSQEKAESSLHLGAPLRLKLRATPRSILPSTLCLPFTK